MELHASQRRDLGQDHMEDEVTIAINGPEVVHCEAVVEESMTKYWDERGSGDGHFVRKSENIKSYFVSSSVDKLRNEPVKNPVMI